MKNLAFLIGSMLFLFLTQGSCSEKNSGDRNPDPSDTSTASPVKILRNDLNFPWEILWGKDDHIWMTERSGRISKLKPEDGSTVFSTTIAEVDSRGEGGLLGMTQHPAFLSNGFLYVVYNYSKNGNYIEKVVRLTYKNDDLSGPLTIIDNIPASNIHNGSRLWITEGADPKLYISTGDAANGSSAQNLNSLSGKILRLNPDGTIPADNPFAGSPVWSLGHRNPQGMVVVNNSVFTAEHGPTVEDEVNIIQKGKNYGWPEVNGPCNGSESSFCTTNGIVEPIWSTGSSTFALSGMDYYDKDLIPAWKNCLLVASLKNATLYVLRLNDQKTAVADAKEYFSGTYGRLRDICISPAGIVYLCTSNGGSDDQLVAINRQ